MPTCLRLAALLLISAALACIAAPAALAQSCHDHLRLNSGTRTDTTISVRELSIPEKAWQHFEKACNAMVSGQADAFDREASLALAVKPDFAEVFLLRAQHQVQLQQYPAAIETISAARRIRPNISWSSIILASALTGLHRYNEAVAELDRGSGMEMATWQWKYEKTRAEIGRLNVQAALHWSELALRSASPAQTDAHLLRANALQLARRPAEAIVEMEAYLASSGHLIYRDQVLRLLERTHATIAHNSATLVAAE